MKTSTLRTLVTLCLGAALGPVSLMAQNSMRATIPFDFAIGSKSFSAGDYTVKQDAATSVVAIQSADHRSAMTLTIGVRSNEAPKKGKLVFTRYGDRYFLSQVWTPGGDVGRQFPKSHAEKELIAKTKSNPVTLVASSK